MTLYLFLLSLTHLCSSFKGLYSYWPFNNPRRPFWHTSTQPNNNNYYYGHDICSGNRELWDAPNIPTSQKNLIGRGIYQTSSKVKQATRLIKKGIGYDLSIPLNPNTPGFGDRYFESTSECEQFYNDKGFCQTNIKTDSIDNYGTQFDYLSHAFAVKNGTNNVTNNDIIFWNNINGNEMFGDVLFNKFNGSGLPVLGVQDMPTLFTRAFLLDIPRSKGMDILPEYYLITSNDIIKSLNDIGYSTRHLEKGDVLLIYTGWERYKTNLTMWYDNIKSPTLEYSPFIDIFDKNGIMMIGMDQPTIERAPYNAHLYWIVCKGGYLHEGLALQKWINDARNRKVPYIGAYIFEPVPIDGANGSPGRPMVYV